MIRKQMNHVAGVRNPAGLMARGLEALQSIVSANGSAAILSRNAEHRTSGGRAEVPSRIPADKMPYIKPADVALLIIFTLGIRLIGLDHPPHIDELNHVLAARSLLEDGNLQINGGEPYTRAWIFTYLVAGLFSFLGESLVVARIPAVLAGTALVVAVFLWVHSVGGRAAAWIAALLLSVYPHAISLSQLARFYTLQALLFWIGAVSVYWLISQSSVDSRRTIAFVLSAALSFGLALHFQLTTTIGIAGLMLWAALVTGPALVRRLTSSRHGTWMALLLAVGLGLSAVALLQTETAWHMWVLFNHTDLWAAEYQDAYRFYHWQLLDRYPTLWTLFPLVLLLAASAHFRATLFCASIFGVAFLLHSWAAWKDERYLFYAMPIFFAVSGLAIAEIIPPLRERVEFLLAGLVGERVQRGRIAGMAVGILVGAALFVVGSNSAFVESYRSLTSKISQVYSDSDWAAAAAKLRPLADSSAVVVSSADLKALYFLGRHDIELSATQLVTDYNGRSPEFTRSWKVARPIISTPESLERVVACYPSGLVIVESYHWRSSWAVQPAAADYLIQHTEPVPLPEQWHLLAFRWRNSAALPPDRCLPLLIGPPS